MVVDSSVVVAVLTGEPAAARFVDALDKAASIQMSAASVLEVSMVIESRYGDAGRKALDQWLRTAPVEIIAVTLDQVDAAREGFRRFGKGRHPAGLNFGDCFSYGLAKTLDETLLFSGNDLSRTDVRAA